MELWQTNVDNSPNNVAALLSQMDIIYSHIDSNDVNDAVVDAAVDELITVFYGQSSLPQKVYYIGNRYRKKANYGRAIHFYQLVGAEWPKHVLTVTAKSEMGKGYVRLGNDEAVDSVIRSLITDHNDHTAVAHRISYIGDEYYYTRQYQKAIDVWDVVCANYPERRRPNLLPYLFATCYEELKDYDRAIEYYELVVEKHPKCKYGHRAPYRLGLLCRRTGQYDKAIEWYKRQRALYPDVEPEAKWSVMSQAATCYYGLKDYGEATLAYRQYIDEYPNGSRVDIAYRWMAKCYDKLGETWQAVAVLQEALSKCTDTEDVAGIRKELEMLVEGGGE